MRLARLLHVAIFALTSVGAHANLGDHSKVSATDLQKQVTALDNSWEYYSGNRQSLEALQNFRRQLSKMRAMGFETTIPRLESTDDETFKKLVDEKTAGLDLKTIRECSFVIMTFIALSQGLCPRQPQKVIINTYEIQVQETPTDR